jgi:membrane protein
VKWKSAFWGALIAGIAWQIANFYFTKFFVMSFQTGFKNALYSGFASLPIILIWLYLAWTVVLLGAEISYAHQNQSSMTWDFRKTKYSYNFKEIVALHILLFVYDKFQSSDGATTYDEIKDYFNLPERIINEIAQNLVALNFIYEVDSDEQILRYTAAQNPEKLTVNDVLSGLKSHGVSVEIEKKSDYIHSIVERVEKEYIKVFEKTFADKSIKKLLEGNVKNTAS